jgi:hypothetical protein
LVGKFEHHDLVALKSPFQDLRAFIGDKDLALELAEYFEEACLIAVVELAPGEFELGDDVDAYGLNDLSALSCGGSLRAESQMRRILNVTRRSRGKTLVGQKAFQNSHLPQSDLPDGSHAGILSSASAKIFRFIRRANQWHGPRVPFPQEGRFAIVTSVGRGMRWTRSCRQTCDRIADGEGVWSWHPWAGAKSVEMIRGRR